MQEGLIGTLCGAQGLKKGGVIVGWEGALQKIDISKWVTGVETMRIGTARVELV